MAAMPERLDELYRVAQADLAAGDPRSVVKWAFWHAKALGAVKLAERLLKPSDDKQTYINMRIASGTTEYQRDELMREMPEPVATGLLQKALCDAMEFESATASVHELLKVRTLGVAVQVAPPLRIIDGGQK